MNYIKLNDVFNIPYVDNFYSEKELVDINQELQFLNKNNKLKTETGAQNTPKDNKGIFVDNVYGDRSMSDILTLNRKLFTLDIVSAFPCMKAIKTSDRDDTLISYYENKSYYKAHIDRSILTALTYFYALPKAFTGGDLYLPDYDATLPCVHNRVYVIPGMLEHEVTPITMHAADEGKGLGRYCMTQFLNYR
jgi:Rps23 Pro-64 3,4-dihydroxylase Tpa1-like proline 4-hydroxylase